MKKLLSANGLIPITIGAVLLVEVCIVNAQSGWLAVKPSLAKVHPLQKNLQTNEASFLTAPSHASPFKKNPSALIGFKLVGFACYDLQSNNSSGRRIINHGDGTFSFVWTIDDDCSASYANRGSGYNYWNGTGLLIPGGATTRIEPTGPTNRTGFGQIALLGNGNEIVMAHKGPPYGFFMSTSPKGAGTWTTAYTAATDTVGGEEALWCRIASGGSDGNSIHLLANYFTTPVINGMKTPMIYSRSTDAGATWNLKSVMLPGYDTSRYLSGGAEDYTIDAEGNTVAIVHAAIDEDVVLWKSTDNGTTFLRTFVDSFLFAPSIDSTGGPTDTAVTCDGAVAVVIDTTGKVHVAYSTVRVVVGGYFPTDAGLIYWNDVTKTKVNIPITIADVDANINGGNFTGAYEVGGATALINNPASATPPNARYGNKAFLSMPSISVDGNNVFILFSLVTDGDSTFDGRSFRDLWVVASSDGGATFGSIQNITCTVGEEEYFGSMAKKADNYLHILYQWDQEPGTSLQNGHAISSNEIRWVVVNKAAVLAGTAHCSASGLGIEEQNTLAFNVSEIYPNPTNSMTYFNVTMKQNANVILEIFNSIGQQIYSSASKLTIGQHTLSVDAGNSSTGLYFYTIKGGDASVVSGKITVVE